MLIRQGSSVSVFAVLATGLLLAASRAPASEWVLRSPATLPPSAQSSHSMAYHPATKRMVVLTSRTAGSTFTYDGTAWRSSAVPSGLSVGRNYAGLVYDAALDKLLLFGGQGGTLAAATNVNETWTYDGTTWVKLTPAASPTARFGHAMASDSANKVVLMHGGFGTTQLNDTWRWNGTTWTKLNITGPPARQGAAMVFDPARKVFVLFGGRSTSSFSDTWEFNGTAWTQKSTAVSPPARFQHAMVYDASQGKVVLFGGQGTASLNDTWEYDGTSWTEVFPAIAPTARHSFALAYDSDRNRAVMFGGSGTAPDGRSQLLNDTVELIGQRGSLVLESVTPAVSTLRTGQTTQLSIGVNNPSTSESVILDAAGLRLGQGETDWRFRLPAASPARRAGHSLVYQTIGRKTWLFGGFNADNALLGDLWSWNGTSWTQTTFSNGPSARRDSQLAYDSRRNLVVLFGGFAGAAPVNDLFEFNGTSWLVRNTTLRPAAVSQHGLAYDSRRGRTVLYGGLNGSGARVADTWEWNASQWLKRAPATSPGIRSGFGFAFDESRGKMVLFGGQGAGAATVGDTWEYDGTAWNRITTSQAPSPRYFASMVYDSLRRRIVLTGGFSAGVRQNDTWEFDGLAWTKATHATPAPARSRASAAFDSGSDQTVLFGGVTTGESVTGDTWELGKQNVTGQYAIQTATDLPVQIPAGGRAVLEFSVTAGAAVTSGQVTIDAVASGTGGLGLGPVSDEAAGAAGTATVLRLAVLEIRGITSPLTQVYQGQTGVTFTMEVANVGDTTAAISATSPQLTFRRGTFPAAFSVRRASTNPATIAAGATAFLTVTADIPEVAPAGSHTADGSIVGRDEATGAVTSDAAAPSPFAFTVFARPSASAGAGKTLTSLAPVTLSGSGTSSTALPLTYHWTIDSKPAASQVTADSIQPNGTAAANAATFTPDVAGTYVLALKTSNGVVFSSVSKVTLTFNPPVAASQRITSPTANETLATDADPSQPGFQALVRWSGATATDCVLVNGQLAPKPTAELGRLMVTLPIGQQSTLALATLSNGSPANAEPNLTVTVAPLGQLTPAAVIRVDKGNGGPRSVVLDGSYSAPADPGAQLTYSWSVLSAPSGFSFGSSQAVTAPFVDDVGDYVFRLNVSVTGGASSSVTTLVRVEQVPPVAAVPRGSAIVLTRPDSNDPSIETTLSVELDGRTSSDANGTALTYQWQIVEAPDRSAGASTPTTLASIQGAGSPLATIVFTQALGANGSPPPLAAAGAYRVRLTVSDGQAIGQSTFEIVTIDPANPGATAVIGPLVVPPGCPSSAIAGGVTLSLPDTIPPFQTVNHIRFDGTESTTASTRPLSYSWKLTAKPSSSSVLSLLDFDSARPRLIPDVIGPYTVELTVTDGVTSSKATRNIFVTRLESCTSAKTGAPASLDEGDGSSPSLDEEQLTEGAEGDPDFVWELAANFGFTGLLAVAQAQNLSTGERTDGEFPFLTALVGDRILLDGSQSKGAASTTWSQRAGPRAELIDAGVPSKKTLQLTAPGFYNFVLTAASSSGLNSLAPVGLYVPDPSELVEQDSKGSVQYIAPPELLVDTMALGTIATGTEVPGSRPKDATATLKARLPTEVTMRAYIPGARRSFRYIISWKQTAGPKAVLSSTKVVAGSEMRTKFTPPKAGLYTFSVSAQRIDALTQYFLGAPKVAKVNVQVLPLPKAKAGFTLSAAAEAPQAGDPPTPVATATPSTLPFDVTITGRGVTTITLDATGTTANGNPLQYRWRLIEGASTKAKILDPTAAITQVTVDTGEDCASANATACGLDQIECLPLPLGKLVFELTVGDGTREGTAEPIYVSVTQPGIDPKAIPPQATGIRLFLNGNTPLSTVKLGSMSLRFDGVILPAGTRTGNVMTLEAVDSEGLPLKPPFVLRTNTLRIGEGGATSIQSEADGDLALSASALGTARTATVQPSAAMLAALGLPAAPPANGGGGTVLAGLGAGGGGGGCDLLASAFGPKRWPNVLVLAMPFVYLLVSRRSRRG